MERPDNTPEATEFYVLVREGEILPDVFVRHIQRNLTEKEQRYVIAALNRGLAKQANLR